MTLSSPQNTHTFFLLRIGLLFMEDPSAVLLKAMFFNLLYDVMLYGAFS